ARADAAPRARRRRRGRHRLCRRRRDLGLADRRDRRSGSVNERSGLELALSLALTKDEYDRIVSTLGREPNNTELAMYAAMWSEHCSYKSSKVYLKTLPTEGEHIVLGPGENAGVVDVGDGLVAVFKLES